LLGVGFLDRAGPAGMAGRALALVGGGLIALPTTEVIGINVSDATLLISGGTMAIIGVLLSRSVSPDSDVRTPLVSGAQI
jgi:hypothetical protein